MYLLGSIFNLSGMDGIIILLLFLLVFGAKRLPELARSLGSALNEFSKAKEDVHRQITQAAEPPPAAPVPSADPAAQAPVPPQNGGQPSQPPQQPPVA